ncbi:hypothetical protein AUJ14_02235 [Candidatus Micrarchaeota archaeon CG1_02_55_22]|nr:MAG: hypothetical protein AUJ14_02235 [Candidatus Micrarchaeota archaeon CG1_02_55_22]
MKKLSLSVIVPTYNEEKLISRTLKNLHEVMPKNTQIIVSDGHSKDGTVRIARKYAKVIYETGHSIGWGRNDGAKASKGDIVLFVDADTFPTKEYHDRMIAAFADPKVVCVGCHILPEKVSLIREAFFYALNIVVAASVAIGQPTIAGSCVAYRRKAFEKEKGFDTETASAEDMDLSRRIKRRGKVVFLYNTVVPTSDRRIHQLGILGLIKDWTRTSILFITGRKTKTYFAPR